MKPNFLIMFLLLAVSSYADTDVRLESRIYKDASSLGMGGVGVSTIGSQNSVMRNPANLGLMEEHDVIPFISLGVYMNHYTIGLYDAIYSAVDTGLDSLDYNSLINQAPAIGFNGPLNLGYMGHGFGIWTTSSIDSAISIKESDYFNGMNIDLNELSKAAFEISGLSEDLSSEKAKECIEKILSGYINTDNNEELETKINELSEKLLVDGKIDADAVKDLLPLAQLTATAEIAVNVAYGYRVPFAFIDDVSGLSLGATVRFAQRYKVTSGEDEINVSDLKDDISNIHENVYHASSISSDFGASLRIENLIISTAVRDAFSSTFAWKKFNSSAVAFYSEIPMSVDFGASYRFYFDNKWIQELGMYIEFEDATSESTTWKNKLRVGQEFKIFNFLDLRVGMYKEFVTGGVGFGWKWFRMDFAYYREQYFNLFDSDQYYLNMTFGLDNSPQRKEKSVSKQLEQDRIQSQNLSFLNQSLDGI